MKRHSADAHRWVTIGQIANEIGRTELKTKRLLARLSWVGIQRQTVHGRITVYNAAALEVIKGLYGIPHRQVKDDNNDWLSSYVNNQQPQGEADE